MENYQDFVEYFEQGCMQNNMIAHSATKKKFFRMNIEEFIMGSHSDLPGFDDGPFFVLINYLDDYKFTHQPSERKQLMFYVLQGAPSGDYDKEMQVRNNADIVVKQWISKMLNDSRTGHAIFQHGLDRPENIRKISHSIHGSANYYGWQVVVSFSKPVSLKYEPNDWTNA